MDFKKFMRLVNGNFKPTGVVPTVTYALENPALAAEEACASGQIIKRFCDRRTSDTVEQVFKNDRKGGIDMRNSGKRTPYWECSLCGSHLDAGEVCDCKKEQQAVLVERSGKEIVTNGAEDDEKTA